MANYILRSIDDDLWRDVKAKAKADTNTVGDSIPLRHIILALLRMYADGKVVVTERTVARRA